MLTISIDHPEIQLRIKDLAEKGRFGLRILSETAAKISYEGLQTFLIDIDTDEIPSSTIPVEISFWESKVTAQFAVDTIKRLIDSEGKVKFRTSLELTQSNITTVEPILKNVSCDNDVYKQLLANSSIFVLFKPTEVSNEFRMEDIMIVPFIVDKHIAASDKCIPIQLVGEINVLGQRRVLKAELMNTVKTYATEESYICTYRVFSIEG